VSGGRLKVRVTVEPVIEAIEYACIAVPIAVFAVGLCAEK